MTEPLVTPPERDLPAASASRIRDVLVRQTRGGDARRVLGRTPAWVAPLTAAAAVAAVVGGAVLAAGAVGGAGPVQPGSSRSAAIVIPGWSDAQLAELRTACTTRVADDPSMPQPALPGNNVLPPGVEVRIRSVKPIFPPGAEVPIRNVHQDALGTLIYAVSAEHAYVCVLPTGAPLKDAATYAYGDYGVDRVQRPITGLAHLGLLRGHAGQEAETYIGLLTPDVRRVVLTDHTGATAEATVMNQTFAASFVGATIRQSHPGEPAIWMKFQGYDSTGRLVATTEWSGTARTCPDLPGLASPGELSRTPDPWASPPAADCLSPRSWP